MPPRLPWQASRSIRQTNSYSTNSGVCLLCRFHSLTSHKAPRKTASWPKISAIQSRKYTHASPATPLPRSAALQGSNSKLHDALTGLQKTAGSYVNLSKLQLALRGLEQGPGNEVIRIAVTALVGKQNSLATVKKLVRLMFADPLKEEQEWERTLLNENVDIPVLLRVGFDEVEGSRIKNNLFPTIYVPSPPQTYYRKEILVLETDGDTKADLLVPTIEIPTSSTGRHTSVTIPVHKALIVGDGLLDVADLTRFSDSDPNIIGTALNLPEHSGEEMKNALTFNLIDIEEGETALSYMREDVAHSSSYEHHWFRSGLPSVLTWLKPCLPTIPTTIAPPLNSLIISLLTDTLQKVATSETILSIQPPFSKISPEVIKSLRKDLDTWAEKAHTELRDDLEIAWNGRRWGKLSWYKLFWHIDDVSLISTQILSQRFLVSSQQELIYLCGKLDQAGIFSSLSHSHQKNQNSKDWTFRGKVDEKKGGSGIKLRDLMDRVPEDVDTTLIQTKSGPSASSTSRWPIHIPATRTYLIAETIPRLQTLAQKLVLQSLGTSSASIFLAGLLYMEGTGLGMIAAGGWGIYEAGAVAAFGVIWGLRVLQRKWDGGMRWGKKVIGGREFWEGEVEEVGRRCIGSAVDEILQALKSVEEEGMKEASEVEREVQLVTEAVEKVRNVLGGKESGDEVNNKTH